MVHNERLTEEKPVRPVARPSPGPGRGSWGWRPSAVAAPRRDSPANSAANCGGTGRWAPARFSTPWRCKGEGGCREVLGSFLLRRCKIEGTRVMIDLNRAKHILNNEAFGANKYGPHMSSNSSSQHRPSVPLRPGESCSLDAANRVTTVRGSMDGVAGSAFTDSEAASNCCLSLRSKSRPSNSDSFLMKRRRQKEVSG